MLFANFIMGYKFSFNQSVIIGNVVPGEGTVPELRNTLCLFKVQYSFRRDRSNCNQRFSSARCSNPLEDKAKELFRGVLEALKAVKVSIPLTIF